MWGLGLGGVSHSINCSTVPITAQGSGALFLELALTAHKLYILTKQDTHTRRQWSTEKDTKVFVGRILVEAMSENVMSML